MHTMPLLSASNLTLSLPDRASQKLLGAAATVDILKGVDLDLEPGESVGIVGESGSGKTSLGRTLLRLYEPTGGRLMFDGQDITHLREEQLRPLRDKIQMIFQDPQSSLNPRHRIEDILAQPLLAFARIASKEEGRRAAAALLERVHLPREFARRFPHELSGGQRQRVGIARALALEPKLIVADEILSGLDVSTQAQILALLREIKAGSALIFISHDLSVVRVLCDRVLVLHRGAVVETGSCEEVFASPKHEYTKALLSAIPLPELEPGWIARGAALEELSSV
jgi:peptide/nickel transport system ATP-binding protein